MTSIGRLAGWVGPFALLCVMGQVRGPFVRAEVEDGGLRFTAWSVPVNLGPLVNSTFPETQPALSRDGLSLYFTTTRPGGLGLEDIWVSRRESADDAWGAPVNLGPPVNTPESDFSPYFTRSGRSMYLTSDRPGGFGSWDLWVSRKRHDLEGCEPPHGTDDCGWQEPVNLGPLVNSAARDAGAVYLEGSEEQLPQLFFTSERPGGQGGFDVYVSEVLGDDDYGAPAAIHDLNSAFGETRPTVRRDGLEILLSSNRPGSVGLFDLWVAERPSRLSPWPVPSNAGPPVNTPSADLQAAISWDRKTMIFASNRPGGSGGFDLYMTTRERITP